MRFIQSIKENTKSFYIGILSLLYVLTPLLFVTNTGELFEFPKTYFIYFLGSFVSAIFFTDLLRTGQKLKFPPPEVLVFCAAFVVSTIFSVHTYTSVWGYYTRFNDNLISLIIYLLLYLVMINRLDQKDILYIIKLSVLTVLPVGLYGIFQHFNIFSTGLFEQGARVFSTFGQPNWLAQYLVMLLPFSLTLFFKENRLVWLLVYLIGFWCLWLTFSLSGLLGFVVSVGLFLIINLRKENIKKFIFVVFLSVILAVATPGIFGSKVQDFLIDVRKLYSTVFTLRVYAKDLSEATTFNKVSDPGFIRAHLWKGTLDLIFSSPKVFFVGSGPETFPYVFQDFRPPELNFSSEWDFVFNKPHNYYLEMWSEQGLLGLLSYLALLLVTFKKIPKDFYPSLLGFVVTNFFGWPVSSTFLLFWLILVRARI